VEIDKTGIDVKEDQQGGLRPFARFIPITVTSSQAEYTYSSMPSPQYQLTISTLQNVSSDVYFKVVASGQNGYVPTTGPVPAPCMVAGTRATLFSAPLSDPGSGPQDVFVTVWVWHNGQYMDPAGCTFLVNP
jgi:hypothetical protein